VLSVRSGQWSELEGRERERQHGAWIDWLKADFPDGVVGRDLATFVKAMEEAAVQIGATSASDVYRVMSLSFLPEAITRQTMLCSAIGRVLVDVEVPIADRLRFIDQLIRPHIPWPAAQRVA
jgi:hypothetical protein